MCYMYLGYMHQSEEFWKKYLHAHESFLQTVCTSARIPHTHDGDAYTYLVVLSWLRVK